ncbi:MAG: hypothetical protein WB507_08550 [Solirubrobacterales bacterium]
MPQSPHRRDHLPPLAVEDRVHQRTVLGYVLSHHPTRFTQGELTRILAVDPEDRDHRQAVIAAIEALVAAGLLRRDGHYVSPTRAAIHFYRLARRT